MKFIKLVLFFIIAIASYGQNNFQVEYPGNLNSVAGSIAVLPDSTYVVAVYYADTSNQDLKIGLIKINSFGDTLWTKRYADNYWVANTPKVVSVSSGGFLLVGASLPQNTGVLCIRTDDNGNPIWIRNHKTTASAETPAVTTTNDGGFATAFRSGSSLTIIKLDSLGNYVWGDSRVISSYGGSVSIGYDPKVGITKTADGGYAAVGISAGGTIFDYNAFIVKYDSLGNLEWTRSLGGISSDSFRNVISTNDGNIMAIGYTQSFGVGSQDGLMVKLDLQGNLLWSKTFGTATGENFSHVSQDINNNYLVSGSKGLFGSSSIFPVIYKTDSLGNLLSSYRLNKKGQFCESKFTLDGNLISAGSMLPSLTQSNAFVRKSKIDGYSACGTTPYPMTEIDITQSIMIDTSSDTALHITLEPPVSLHLDNIPLTVDVICNVTPSYSTISDTVCDIYISPSGNYTWTTSGQYSDTLFEANSTNGDSIITINLVINNSTYSTIIDSIDCLTNTYTSPSGNHIWTMSGTYADTLFGANVYGCDSIITIHLSKNCELEIDIPNIFTPNRDGINDLFKAKVGFDVEFIHTSIYNRWGECLFDSNQINEGWNGRLTNGKEASEGTYFYIIEIKKRGDTFSSIYKGTLTLLR